MRQEIEDCLSAIRIDVQMIESVGPGRGYYCSQLEKDMHRLKYYLGMDIAKTVEEIEKNNESPCNT